MTGSVSHPWIERLKKKGYLDRVTAYDRVRRDDVSIKARLPQFTPAQSKSWSKPPQKAAASMQLRFCRNTGTIYGLRLSVRTHFHRSSYDRKNVRRLKCASHTLRIMKMFQNHAKNNAKENGTMKKRNAEASNLNDFKIENGVLIEYQKEGLPQEQRISEFLSTVSSIRRKFESL